MQITKQLIRTTGIFIALGMLLTPMAADARQKAGGGSKGSQAGLSSIIANLPYQDLSAVEEAGLIHMREEEKLARDVYEILYNKWGLTIFSNIAQAEQRHMVAVKSLLDKYNVPDPITDLTVGVFPTPEVQELYNALVEEGNKSLVDALHVGATIEDLDIKDLYDYLIETDNLDIKTVYQNLVKGSRNHLRTFVYQLSLNGATYEAQYLTQDEIDDIVTSPRERGRVDEDGNPVTGGNMGGGQGGPR
jgi:hypothetical protein